MTDRHDESSDPNDEAVRRLLAAAARPAPALPDQVAARLDGVLADLAHERGPGSSTADGPRRGEVPPLAADGSAGPADLAAHRRRRRWPQLLVAAAAVSVIGVGLGNVLSHQGGDDGGEAATAGGSTLSESTETVDDSDERAADRAPGDGSSPLTTDPLPRLRSGSLAVDIERVQLFAASTAGDERQVGCVRPLLQDQDELLPVRLDGEEAVLVLGAPREGVRRAEIYTCDGARAPAVVTSVDAP